MRGPRRSRLSEADIAEWADYARHVRVLPGRAQPALTQPVLTQPVLTQPILAQVATALPLPTRAMPIVPAVRLEARVNLGGLSVGSHPPGVDNATWGRFRTGKMSASRTLDLHGRTAQRAFHSLVPFLRTAHADGVRCVEVITGRGSGETGGVLRRELPLWLNLPELRPLVLAAAHPHAANPGSVRILIRRVR